MQENLISSAFDALPSLIAILNNSGVIVYVNRQWKELAYYNKLAISNFGIGSNYLEYCDIHQLNNDLKICNIAQSIREVISGEQETFLIEYTCHSPSEQKWFLMRVLPFDYEGNRHVVVIHENITPNKIAESRLKNILENAPIGMAITSLDGRFMESNQALEQLLGYDEAELLNLTCEQITHPEDANVGEELMRELINKKQGSYRIEKRFVRKDDNIVWVNLTSSILCNGSGTPIQIIKQIQDITKRIQTENDLRESEHRLKLVLNHMPALIGYWNKDLRNEFGNKVYTDWFGIDPAHIKGMHLREVIGDFLYVLNKPYIEKVLQGETQHFECTLIDTQGIQHYTLASYIPDVSDQKVKGFFVLVTDITQIKRTELELTRSEELSRIVLGVSIDGFIFSDLTGKFIDVSTSFCDMLGYSKAEMLNMAVFDIEYSERDEEVVTHLDEIIAKGFDRFETMHRRKDGTLIDVEVSVAYLDDNKQLFAFIRDITQRKQTEKLRIRQLEQQRDVLIREVHHRIKNHLQGVVGFLGFYSNKEFNKQDFIQDIAAKISSIALVYGLQGKNNQDRVFLCDITREVCHSLNYFGLKRNCINYSVKNDFKASLSSEFAVPIAIIINELIVNAIKHNASLPIQSIDVNLSINEKNAVLCITNKSFLKSDFPDFEQTVGLGVGLALVHALLPRQGATLSLRQQYDVVRATLIVEEPIITTELS